MTKYLVIDGGLVRDSGRFIGITGPERSLKAIEDFYNGLVKRGILTLVHNGIYRLTEYGESVIAAELTEDVFSDEDRRRYGKDPPPLLEGERP